MTRKDYIAIAEVFQRAMFRYDDNSAGKEALLNAADMLAGVMYDDNPRFDREHFLAVVRGERELQSRPPRRRAA